MAVNNQDRQLAMQSGKYVIRQRLIGFARGTRMWWVYSPEDGKSFGFYDFRFALSYAIRVSEAAKEKAKT